MYNRYVPQSDGSFQRNRMPDKTPPSGSPPPPPQQPAQPPPPPSMPIIQSSGGPFGFLKQILPKGFDFGDLAILFLLEKWDSGIVGIPVIAFFVITKSPLQTVCC